MGKSKELWSWGTRTTHFRSRSYAAIFYKRTTRALLPLVAHAAAEMLFIVLPAAWRIDAPLKHAAHTLSLPSLDPLALLSPRGGEIFLRL